jgi:hypothetical protein
MDWSQFDDAEQIMRVFAFEYKCSPPSEDAMIEHMIKRFVENIAHRIFCAMIGHVSRLPIDVRTAIIPYLRSHGLTECTLNEYSNVPCRLVHILNSVPDFTVMLLARWEVNAKKRIDAIRKYIDTSGEGVHGRGAGWDPRMIIGYLHQQGLLFGHTAATSRPMELAGMYAEWRSMHLRGTSFTARVECASLFAREHGAVHVADMIGNDYNPNKCTFGNDMRPCRAFLSSGTCYPMPYAYGDEFALTRRTRLECATIIEYIVPDLLGSDYNFVDACTVDEMKDQELVDRHATSSVTIEYLHHACDVPLSVVDIIVGYMRPWRSGAPKMILTPTQQIENDAFVEANTL